jgi:hypothetical protein
MHISIIILELIISITINVIMTIIELPNAIVVFALSCNRTSTKKEEEKKGNKTQHLSRLLLFTY